MTKQRNYVAKNDFNKGGAHKDKSKTLPRDEKYANTIENWENGTLGCDEDFVKKVDIDESVLGELLHDVAEMSVDELKTSLTPHIDGEVGKIISFVEDLYKDGKTPCERFGMTWEMLGELENEMFGENDENN